jgi:hypothetical protein
VTVVVSIEVCQEGLHERYGKFNGKNDLVLKTYISFGLGDLNTVLLHANKEFTSIDLSVSVVGIELSESSAESSNGG